MIKNLLIHTLIAVLIISYVSDEVKAAKNYSIQSSTCVIYEEELYSDTVKKVLKENMTDLVCDPPPPLVRSDNYYLWIDEKSKKIRGLEKSTSLQCCYVSFRLTEARTRLEGDIMRFGDKCNVFSKMVRVRDEFVLTICMDKGVEVYRDTHAFIISTPITPPSSSKKPSVLIFGLESVSRENLMRQMPKTLQLFKSDNDFELKGYSRVGESTLPNLIALLTGLNMNDYEKKCIRHGAISIEECPLLWKDYKKRGYVTALGEDTASWSTFLREAHTFSDKPTDFYLQPFVAMNRDIHGNNANRSQFCSGPRPRVEKITQYCTKFVNMMITKKNSFFGLFWTYNISPDHFNIYPNIDSLFMSFFKNLQSIGAFENTIIIFMSNQGANDGDFITTKQGILEEGHPFAFVKLPSWIKNKHQDLVKCLTKNTKKLVTPYDIGAGLRHFLNIFKKTHQFRYGHGKSLFTNIYGRTCLKAAISPKLCPCDGQGRPERL